MIRGHAGRGAPAGLAALTVLLSACSDDSTSGAAAPADRSVTTAATQSQAPIGPDPTLTPQPGEVVEFDQHGPEYVFAEKGRYAVRVSPSLVYEVGVPDMWEVFEGRFLSTSDYSEGDDGSIFFVAEAPAGGTLVARTPLPGPQPDASGTQCG